MYTVYIYICCSTKKRAENNSFPSILPKRKLISTLIQPVLPHSGGREREERECDRQMIEEEIEEGGREGDGKKERDEGRRDREEVVIKIKEKKGEKGEKMRVRDMKEKNR